jgi:hypothetical protein
LPNLKTELLTIIERYTILSVDKNTHEPAAFLWLQLELNEFGGMGVQQWLKGVRHTLK